MNLGAAFHSLDTTGIQKLNHAIYGIGHLLARPFRMAVQLAFGNNNMEHAMAGWANSLQHYLFGGSPAGAGREGHLPVGSRLGPRIAPQGALEPIVDWFNKQDFTATGARWGNELAKGIMYSLGSVLKSALHSSTALGAGAGGIIGAILGTAVNPGAGTLIGGALGAGIGAVLGHLWTPLKQKARAAWDDIRSFSLQIIGEVGRAIIAFLGPSCWHQIEATAKTTWGAVKSIGRDAFSVVRTTAMLVWAVLRLIWAVVDTLIIKTGVWKLGVLLVRGVIQLVALAFQAVVRVIGTVIHWIAKAYNWVAGGGGLTAAVNNLTSAWGSVSNAIGGVIGDIQTAVGWAQSLYNTLTGSSSAVTHHFVSAVKGHGSATVSRPKYKGATGGIVRRPTYALIGESGPEAVVPLNRAPGAGPLGGGATINLNGPIIGSNPQLVARELARILQPYLGGVPSINIAGA
jgi:hypothetical protein